MPQRETNAQEAKAGSRKARGIHNPPDRAERVALGDTHIERWLTWAW
jgi:hypothetical protein